tara:strand:- start:33 stop:293 length:261 start_codon:yes stop_codon:yes gene_type:complete
MTMASSKSKLTESQLIEGIIDKIMSAMMQGRLDKVEPILKVGSPRLKKLAKQADKSRQAFKRELQKDLKKYAKENPKDKNVKVYDF